MLAMAVMGNLNHNTMPIDQLMQCSGGIADRAQSNSSRKLKRNLDDPRANSVNIGLSGQILTPAIRKHGPSRLDAEMRATSVRRIETCNSTLRSSKGVSCAMPI